MKKWVLSLVIGYSLAGLAAEFEFEDPSHFVAFYLALTSSDTQGTDNPSNFFSYKNDFYSERYKDSVIEFDNTVKKIQELKDDTLDKITITYSDSLKNVKGDDDAILKATDELYNKFKILKEKDLPKDIFALSFSRLDHLKSYQDLKATKKCNNKALEEHWGTYHLLTSNLISFGDTGKSILYFSELLEAAKNRLLLREAYDKWLLRYKSYEEIKKLSMEKLDELNEQTAKILETLLADKESKIYSPEHPFSKYLNLFIGNWEYIVKSEKHKKESIKDKDGLSIDDKNIEIIESIELKLDHTRNDKSLEDIIFHSELEIIEYNPIRAAICDNFSSKIKLAIIAAHKIDLEKKRIERELDDLRLVNIKKEFNFKFETQKNVLTNEANKALHSTLNNKGNEKNKLSQSFEYIKRLWSNQQVKKNQIIRSSSLPNGNLDGFK